MEYLRYQWLAGNSATHCKAFSSYHRIGARLIFSTVQPAVDWRSWCMMIRSRLVLPGLVKDWEQNSDFGFKDLSLIYHCAHFSPAGHERLVQGQTNANVLVKLSPALPSRPGEKQLPAFYQRHRHLPDEIKVAFSLQPLADIHFNARNYDTYAGAYNHIDCTGGHCIVILVIAAINLSTCPRPSILRAKEVGVRKVLGSSRAAWFHNSSLNRIIVLAA